MACSLLAEKSKWNLRATCTISHTSRHTTRFIHRKLSKSTICTLLGKRDDCHVWVGKLLLVCAHRDFIDKYLEKRNYGSIWFQRALILLNNPLHVLDYYKNFQDTWWLSYGCIVSLYHLYYGSLFYMEETYSL